jgi:hypothetical protein
MPKPPDLTIDLADANIGENDVDKGTTIAWHNSTNSDIRLNPPSCVSPSNPTDIPSGQTTTPFNVSGSKNKTYDYTFDVGAEVGTRNGTIRVNP